MGARVGDWIVVHGRTLDDPVREGRIDELLHADGVTALPGPLAGRRPAQRRLPRPGRGRHLRAAAPDGRGPGRSGPG